MTDWKNPPKLFIPGPVHVLPEVLQQLARPTLGHRNKEYSQLHKETVDMLKKILFTEQHIFLCTSSASGIWEASIRNCVKKDEPVLCTMCGAFSDKWADVARSCGRIVDELKVEWGQATTPELIDKALSAKKYAAVTLVYNETSTGLTNPVYEISEMMKRKYPDVLVFVDAVSGMVGLPIHFDQLGWDVVFASVQKAFAIPPGFTVTAVSNRALEKSKSVPERGYYFDFQAFAKAAEKDQTPTTPSIPHIMALHYQCTRLLEEGMEHVWARHKEMGDYARAWAKEHLALFCEEKYASNTLTTVKNTRGIDIPAVIKAVQAKHNVLFGNGYGKLKNETFRVAHMGDITLEDLKQVLAWIEEEIR
ncbi:MAG TPA: alanine--glyoxylate aminotransferase family protein [Anaerohalosphaeraceae bacterium]|jgi:aspartate aminotransferase-like enzyme|nr:alanine--glyoxylate aminotransferase family protein [Anaerohalosphaeraceae bacterium]HQG05591.1 alanine--glyoxylate aminotransferase family protein [Anaerohalosphaeraceae bacterium]HQI07353.1 alanine--glyoxylate aminotransferase family protein [Anaerohalosphaeraceae bacterium]HQJ67539.1 alanine--glyoxylate aminotransferase family protein [Anaerohalosphaeraceae bacterium]HRU14785.1 alanine--glyoxylate aminotransferase family protein [Anaerohalosphaeraceae bacterium]